MSAAGSYPRSNVKDRRAASADEPRRLDRTATDDTRAVDDTAPGGPDDPAAADRGVVDLSGLSIAGITRRRVGWVAAGFLSVWILIVFARQVGDATAAANLATQVAAENTALAAEVEALREELALIVRPEYVSQQARGYTLGASREIPFTLDSSIPDPVDGAPGSASARLGAAEARQTPLESWLSLLFGPG